MQQGEHERYVTLARECAERACESFTAWCSHGFMAGFFLAVRQRGVIRLPSSRLLSACLTEAPATAEEAENRIAFMEALVKEAMALQSRQSVRRGKLVSMGMVAAIASLVAVLAIVVTLAAYGLEFAAVGAMLGAASAWMAGGIVAERRENALFAAAGETGENFRFVPWEDGFAAAFTRLRGTVSPDIHLGF